MSRPLHHAPALVLLAAGLWPLGAGAAPLAEPSIAVGLDTAYDSNVFNGRGPDLVTRVSPHAALLVRNERLKLQLAYDLGVWVYATGTAENSINHRGLANLEARLSRRLTVRLADEVIYAN